MNQRNHSAIPSTIVLPREAWQSALDVIDELMDATIRSTNTLNEHQRIALSTAQLTRLKLKQLT